MKATRKDDGHKHDFKDYGFFDEERCVCGITRISEAEYIRRKNEWDNYYRSVQNTEAYSLYNLAHAAFKEKNWVFLKEISGRCHQLNSTSSNELSKPKFQDPERQSYYGFLVVKKET